MALRPYLSKLVLPRGVVVLPRDRPGKDLTLVATKASLVVRRDLHPAIQYLLLEAASEVHGAPGVFNKAGEFPAAEPIDLPLSTFAHEYYRSGPPFLQRHLPFWLAALTTPLLVLIPVVGLLYPLSRLVPELYRWYVHRGIFRLYSELKFLEAEFEASAPDTVEEALSERLDRLEERADHLHVPRCCCSPRTCTALSARGRCWRRHGPNCLAPMRRYRLRSEATQSARAHRRRRARCRSSPLRRSRRRRQPRRSRCYDWRRDGVKSIALVALDRLTARRVRALLERAQVTVLDETGWKLSTTSAAAAVMRWYDLVADDLYWRDLIDWLKSVFTLAGRPSKAQEVAAFERAIRASGALQGAGAIRRTLAEAGARDRGDAVELAGASEVLDLLAQQMQAAQRAGPTLAAHLRALGAALDALGMRTGLEADPVGRAVLREIAALETELGGVAGRATLADFRALLASRFEDAAYVDAEVDSPVALVSLAATALRRFDAALLIGADAQHLPAVPGESHGRRLAARVRCRTVVGDGESFRGARLPAAA